jgi:glycerol kinase
MGNDCILAIDQGTTNTKALLVDRSGAPVFRVARPIMLSSTPEGFTEQDPELIWESVANVATSAAEYAKEHSYSVAAIAISNQRETALAWDVKSGKASAPAISWQCGRGAAICARLAPHSTKLRSITGLPIAPLISATKWAWLLENNSAVQQLNRENRLRLGTVDTWLLHRLTCGEKHATDLTNASRTGLLNLASLDWDREALDLFGISLETLPELQPSSHRFGYCAALAELSGIPIMSAIGDSHAAMFGHAIYKSGTVKATYGTGTSLVALTTALASDAPMLARTIAWSIGKETQYAVEGNIPMTGSAIQWLGEFLGFQDPTGDMVARASTVENSGGVFFVPAMVGLGAPYWDAEARGAILGLGRHHTSAHLARAALEAIAFQIADVYFAMEAASGLQFNELRADGGATRNASLMQFQADVLRQPVLRSLNEELSAIGAAWLSGLALGWWGSVSDLERLAFAPDRFVPTLESERSEQLYKGWKEAVSHVRRFGSVAHV